MKLNKNNIKKIIILILVIILFKFIAPYYSYGLSLIPGIGGVLNKPIVGLLMLPIDGVNLALNVFLGVDPDDEDTNGILESWSNFFDGKNVVEAYFNAMMSPDKIFKGQVDLLDANIFAAPDTSDSFIDNISSGKSLASSLKKIVSNIYILLRNIAAVILLCLLIYTGIRILLQSAHPYEQAKWKETLLDWIKALCLLMFMHYLMIGVFTVSDLLVNSLSGSFGDTSIIAQIRISFSNTSALTNGGLIYWIYLIMYGYVTYLTIVFVIAYFKRFVWIIICIIISPIVAVTVALGGKSQTFGKWFKEYIFAVLLQPFHMLIFFVLVALPLGLNGSNSVNWNGLATSNFEYTTMIEQIYILISISMIRPAEKFFMGLFGFSSSQIAKQGSSESGVKTIKVVTDGIKQAIQLVAQVGLAVATGGASAAASAAGGATTTASKLAESTGKESLMKEGQSIATDREALNYLTDEATDPNSDWTDRDLQALNELNQEQEEGGASYNRKLQGEQETQKTLDKTQKEEARDMLENDKQAEKQNDASALKEAAGDLKEAARELKGEGANTGDTSQNLEADGKVELKGDQQQEIDASDEEFDEAMGLNKRNKLAKALGISEESYAATKGGLKNYLRSPDFAERANNLWANANQLRDTMYLEGGGEEWKNGPSIYNSVKNRTEEVKKSNMEAFINNPNNIQYMLQNHPELLAGIENCKTPKERAEKVEKAENKVKEILKGAEPYVNMGITDISTIDKLIAKQNSGMSPTGAMTSFIKTELLSRNNQKIEAVAKVISERTGLDSNSPTVRTQAKQTMQQAKPYIEAGKRDPEVLDRLVRLENNLKNERVAQPLRTPERVIAMDKVIDKALKQGLKQVKVTNPNSSAGMKEIEKLMNKELKGRQAEISFKQTTTTKTTQNESREKIGLAEGPKKPKGT